MLDSNHSLSERFERNRIVLYERWREIINGKSTDKSRKLGNCTKEEYFFKFPQVNYVRRAKKNTRSFFKSMLDPNHALRYRDDKRGLYEEWREKKDGRFIKKDRFLGNLTKEEYFDLFPDVKIIHSKKRKHTKPVYSSIPMRDPSRDIIERIIRGKITLYERSGYKNGRYSLRVIGHCTKEEYLAIYPDVAIAKGYSFPIECVVTDTNGEFESSKENKLVTNMFPIQEITTEIQNILYDLQRPNVRLSSFLKVIEETEGWKELGFSSYDDFYSGQMKAVWEKIQNEKATN